MRKNRQGQNCSKRVIIHVRSLAAPTYSYTESVRQAELIYGNIGILFQINSELCPALSAAADVELAVIDGACKWDQFNTEQTDLYAMGQPGPNGVTVFIVGGIRQPDGSTLSGCAGHAVGKPSAVVSASGTVYTMAHEVGHVLLGSTFTPVHTTDNSNVMVNGTFHIAAGTTPSFSAAQRAQILKSPLLDDV